MSGSLPELEEECFVISPIGDEGSQERERSDGVLEFIIARAAEELGLTAVRGDQLAEPGQITLQVIDHILGARAAVADLTGLNANVFYELAVRHTVRLPVALIAERNCKLPFDIAQMRTIFFESTNLRSSDQCRKEIVSHLRQALDKNSADSPIATSVDIRALAGGSAAERNIAEIVTTIEEVAKMQRTISRMIDNIGMAMVSGSVGDKELLDILERVTIRLAELEIEAAKQGTGDNSHLQSELHELNETLGITRRAAMRNRSDYGRRSGLGGVSSKRLTGDDAGPNVAARS